MTTDQLYDVLDTLPKGSGRWRVIFDVVGSGMGAASCQLGVFCTADEECFCITSDDGGDAFHSIDELKFRLSHSFNSKVLFLDNKYWEEPHVAECYEIVECSFEKPRDVNEDGNLRFVHCLLRVKMLDLGTTIGTIQWLEDCFGDEVNQAVSMKQSKMTFCNPNDPVMKSGDCT